MLIRIMAGWKIKRVGCIDSSLNRSSRFTLHSDYLQQLLAVAKFIFQHKAGHMVVLKHDLV